MRNTIVRFACALVPMVGSGCFGFDEENAPEASSAPYDPCAPGAILDLEREGVRRGDMIQIVETNALVGSMAPLGSSCGTPNGSQVVFRFTPRRSGRLHVTTDTPATSFNTVVWVQDRCVASGARALGCNDDGEDSAMTSAASMVTTEAVTAGAPVFIVVAGFRGAQGTFGLSVTELAPDGAYGGACRRSGLLCDGGLSCGHGVCVAEGESGGRCRDGGASRCDAGLVCGARLGGEVCGLPRAVGSPCSFAAPTCAPGAFCSFILPSPRCVAVGDLGGRCREGNACDDGLVCSGDFCVREVVVGGACNPRDVLRPCVARADCVRVGADDRCVSRGARSGRCRDASVGAPCDAGLACRGERCTS